jgi:predicted nicotinamide N-methyase
MTMVMTRNLDGIIHLVGAVVMSLACAGPSCFYCIYFPTGRAAGRPARKCQVQPMGILWGGLMYYTSVGNVSAWKKVVTIREVVTGGRESEHMRLGKGEGTPQVVAAELPPSPRGAIRLHQEPVRVAGTCGVLSPSALVLCRWLLERPDELLGSAVLELGCGMGACGIFAAALGASRVLLTDGEAASVALAARNVRANRTLLGHTLGDARTWIRAESLRWGSRHELPPGKWDWVIASDAIYSEESWTNLADTAQRALLEPHRPRVLLALPHRHPGPLITDEMWADAPDLYATTLLGEERPNGRPNAQVSHLDVEHDVAVSVIELKLRACTRSKMRRDRERGWRP